MRVAQFLSQYPGRDGTSAYGTGLSRAMNRIWSGSCPVISTRNDQRRGPVGVELINYPNKRRLPGVLPSELITDLKDGHLKVDGVVIHGVFNPRAITLANSLRGIGIPYAFMPHDPYVAGLLEHGRMKKKLFLNLFERPMIRNSQGVILLAESHDKFLREMGYRGPVRIVSNGCDPGSLAAIRGGVVIPGKLPISKVLYLGRMDRNHKGLDLLLEGFSLFLKRENSRVELILTGNDWEDRQELENLSKRLKIESHVKFTGPREDVSVQIHSEADAVILPSRFDGFGLTVVEAMLASRPVMVSCEAGVAEHVRKSGGGVIFKPHKEAISSAFSQMLAARESWSNMGARNNAYVINNLTWEKTAKKTMKAYVDFFG